MGRPRMALYFQLFWLPAIASILLLALLWAETDLSGETTLLLAGWFLLALTVQYLATATGVWIVGLTSQTALAIFLVLKRQLS
jgi:4-amino-4-deoxy-L-arabinose transferase-like glycosyltransferase